MIENIMERHTLKRFLNPEEEEEEEEETAEFLLFDKASSFSWQTFEMDCSVVSCKI